MSTGDSRLPVFYLYSRSDCHLCEVLLEELLPLIHGRARLEVRDVDSNDAWRARYGLRIPLVEFDGQVLCQYRIDRAAIQEALQGCVG